MNIYKELKRDLNIDIPNHGYLQSWADQGVLLLNTTMTVERANANAHAGKGWQHFTDRVIEVVSEHQPNLVFLLWGAHAQSKQKLIDATKHLVLTSVHPSPLSAYRGFWGAGISVGPTSSSSNMARRLSIGGCRRCRRWRSQRSFTAC